LNWASACLLVLLAGTARAEAPDKRQMRDLAARWAEYYAAVYRVPVDLVEAIIDEESGWDPCAVSSKGAAGLMQLMPGTAVRFGVHNRFRIDENIHGGVAYLTCLKQRFNGDLRLMTAAYYVGDGPISRRGLDYSSPDVQRYVRRVSRRYRARRMESGDGAEQLRKRIFGIKSRESVAALSLDKLERGLRILQAFEKRVRADKSILDQGEVDVLTLLDNDIKQHDEGKAEESELPF